jgi:hypothetical protein
VQGGIVGAGIALAHLPPLGTPLPPSGLQNLSVSYDAAMVSESPAGAFGGAVGTYVVIEQGGILYWSAPSSIIWLNPVFQPIVRTGLTQSSFFSFDVSASHPNFATGGPIRVGFATSNGNANGGQFAGGASVGSTVSVFDNFVVSFAASASVSVTVPGCGGITPASLNVSPAILGGTVMVSVTNAFPSAPGAIYTSSPPAAPTPLAGCLIGLDLATAAELVSFTTDSGGSWSQGFGLPPDCALAGAFVAAQAVVIDPGASGFALTNGLVVVLGF